jgi:hypothetical protein
LIDIAFAVTMTDVQDCLRVFGKEIDKSTIQRYLFLLEHLKLIKEEYLNGSFYISGGGGPYISYDFNAGAHLRDRQRAKVLIRNDLDETRKRILRRYLRGPNTQLGRNEVDRA